MSPVLKKPKLEETIELESDADAQAEAETEEEAAGGEDVQEEAVMALMEHRAREVDHLKKRLAYYQTQMEEAQARLRDSQAQLVRLLSRRKKPPPKPSVQPVPKPKLVIPPAFTPKVSILAARPRQERVGSERSGRIVRSESQGKVERTKHRDLVPLVGGAGSPAALQFSSGTYIASQHKRKLRSLALSPVDDELFVTSALDGVVNLWRLQAGGGNGSAAVLAGSIECVSPRQRRWPEDIAWHPNGGCLYCAYTADGGDSQVSILNLNLDSSGHNQVLFLEDKPHSKGIINRIVFMPWEGNLCLATGGSDHGVVLWRETDEGKSLWKPNCLHKNLHSSAVMGVAGMQQSRIVISAGVDKKIIGFDVEEGKARYKHQIDSKCMNVLPNPSDFNLVMVQSGAPEEQLRLFDIRMKPSEILAFGWKQESSESQSALISQAWSPDGLYISSGSADPVIHIFDIRYKAPSPSQSVKAHQKRVFRAAWHRSRPLLVSISSDLQIGLHQIASS